MRLLICAGGTGGGVYPALNVLRETKTDLKDVLWVGGEGGIEADLVQRAGVAYESIPAAGVHGVSLKSLPGNILQLVRGVAASRRILRRFKPDVLFFTGGFVAVPMAAAGWRIPSMLFVPDIEPGLAIKAIASFASRITVPNKDAFRHYPPRQQKKLLVTGYPVRADLGHLTKEQARQQLGLDPNLPVLLVTGGSKGAQTINKTISALLPSILTRFQVLHISGSNNFTDVQQVRQQLPQALQQNYHIYAYLHDEMSAALASADLIISRAGASTLGEYPMAGTPAILIPYPWAWRYQKVNAEYLQRQNAAIFLRDEEMPEKLGQIINDLFDHPAKLEYMRQCMASLSQPQAATNIAQVLMQLADNPRKADGREVAP